jgi:hypothetical protein
MKLSLLPSTAALLLGLTTSLSGFAQVTPANGTVTGTNMGSVSAGTGNAGDKTQQVGSSTKAAKPHAKHRHHRAHHAASAASGA